MKCKRCKVEKELLDTGRCSGCEEYCQNYYKENRKQEIARAQKSNRKKSRKEINDYKRDLNRRHPLNVLVQQAKSRAKKKGVPFDLKVSDLEIPDVCPILGISLVKNDKVVGKNSYSIDRIIPELGYVKGNVAVISHKANTIKNNASIEELEKVLNWLKEIKNDMCDSNKT